MIIKPKKKIIRINDIKSNDNHDCINKSTNKVRSIYKTSISKSKKSFKNRFL